eukprot:3722243-Prymnesium_polylepis.1
MLVRRVAASASACARALPHRDRSTGCRIQRMSTHSRRARQRYGVVRSRQRYGVVRFSGGGSNSHGSSRGSVTRQRAGRPSSSRRRAPPRVIGP